MSVQDGAMANNNLYTQIAKSISHVTGRPSTFSLAVVVIVLWLVSGPIFNFSDTWQLVINTGTTIITFLMVFLIQNTQNRDTAAIQLKLDELVRAHQGAHNAILDLEELDDQMIEAFRDRYRRLASEARAKLARGEVDTDTPDP